MPNLIKHLILLGFAFPLSITGYHIASGSPGGVNAATRSITERLGDMALGSGYDLSELNVLQRDLWWIETRYVEKERLDPEAMFQSALDLVERQVPEVMFQREPGGKRLHISAGSYSTILLLESIDTFGSLHSQLQRVAAVLEDHLSEDYDHRDVEYGFINGALSTLDPHSMLMPPEASREMDVENQGEFGGLGIEITNRDGKLTVKNPIAGTPADRAGLKSDDHIVRIEDESTINMDLSDAVKKLRGPVGTPVEIKIMRKGFTAPKSVKIVRDKVKINQVEGELLEGNIGFVQIKNFHQHATHDLEMHLAKFRRENGNQPIQGLVLDLRSNPGGYLTQAVDVSNKFLRDGVIVSTVEGAGDSRQESRASSQETEPDYPIAVLVNATSASASEIVAGALRNHDRAIIIGERTFGKGSVQHLYNNNDESRLKLTVAKYLTPGDQSIQSVGIPPDILLQPSVVEPADPAEGDGTPTVSLYYRDWVDREADLDHHLEQVGGHENQPAYIVRYLKAMDDEDVREPDPSRDWEVQFARQILLQAQSARRADVLQAAAPVVNRVQREEAQNVREAFARLDIDWSPGSQPTDPKLEMRLDLGDDGILVAGQEEMVRLEVTNVGTEPIHQLSAVTSSDNPWLEHREFYFGRVDPGQTRSYAQPVLLHYGYGDAVSPTTIAFRTPDNDDLLTMKELVRSRGQELPQFAYTPRIIDDGSHGTRGDADGLPDVGEIVALEVAIDNIGEGASQEAFARVKNESGRALDLIKGSAELGEALRDGKPCEPGSEECARRLAPGESDTGVFVFELREAPANGQWDVELLVGDSSAFDYGSIQAAGFFDYFQLSETIALKPGQPLDGTQRRPPEIKVTRGPELSVSDNHLVVSGVVHDDSGLRDVIVFHGDDKVFFQGGDSATTSLPFTAERSLEVGSNLVVILARDVNGLSTTRAIRTWYEEPSADRTPTAGLTPSSG